eukprot:gene48487-65045_t
MWAVPICLRCSAHENGPVRVVSRAVGASIRGQSVLAMPWRCGYELKRYREREVARRLGEGARMAHTTVAVIEGDGIGKEVVPQGVAVVDAVARLFGLDIGWDRFDWGCDYHARHGRMMPESGLNQIANHAAIFLGAIGWPTVSDVESLWTLLMPIRRNFQQYVNL